MDNFLIILPCNKPNNLSNFKVKLPLSVSLTGSWEVAVTELSFTNSWNMLATNQFVELLLFKDKQLYVDKNENAVISSGNYTIADLVLKINETIGNYLGYKYDRYGTNLFYKKRKLSHIPEAKLEGDKVTLYPGVFEDNHELLIIRPESKLCKLLNIDYANIMIVSRKLFDDYSKSYPYLKAPEQDIKFLSTNKPFNNISSFNVYTNICQNRIVGSLLKPLLRMVRLPKHMPFGEQFTITYDNPQYIRLLKNVFDEIWIKIKDSVKMYDQEDEESYIPFQFGETVVTLHFKKLSDYEVPSELSPPQNIEFDDDRAKENPLDTEHKHDDVERI